MTRVQEVQTGRVALVTGAGKGIGRAAAVALAREGVKVALLARDDVTGQEAVAACHAVGGEALWLSADVASEEQVRAAFGKLEGHWGRLDILVNNAGIHAKGDVLSTTLDDWERIQRVNVTGINHANLKVVCTHCGIEVGEDGPTHQVVDTIGLLRNLPGTRVLLPADPNQADAMTRHMATTPGNMFMLMGRSKVPVILNDAGEPFYGEAYDFVPGAWDWLREGGDGLIAAWGAMTTHALVASDAAEKHGIHVGVVSIPSLDRPSDGTLAKLRCVPWVVTVEDHWAETGIGGWLSFVCMKHGITPRMWHLGPTELPFSGAANDVYEIMGLDAAGILAAVKHMATSVKIA